MLAPFLKLIFKTTSFSISYHLDQPLPSSRPPFNVENRVYLLIFTPRPPVKFLWSKMAHTGVKSIRGDHLRFVSGVLGRASKPNLGHFWGRFLPSLPPANPIKILWSKMARRGVPHIVVHILCSTRTYCGHFRLSKVSFSAILADLGQ